ncbi:MAG: hypothetical protein AAF730_08120 [Bacteroidota bacterium]
MVDPPSDERSADPVAVARIIWTFDTAYRGGAVTMAEDVAVHHLVFDTTAFYGDDACRDFYAAYTMQAGRIVPADFLIQTGTCCGETLGVDHLDQAFTLRIDQHLLTITAGTDVYRYRSAYREPVSARSWVDQPWRLHTSDDEELRALEAADVPSLRLGADRTYAITWNCTDEGTSCSAFTGLWGLGEQGALQLYGQGGRTSGGGAAAAATVAKLHQATRLRTEGQELVLVDEVDAITHRFRHP